jgi:cytochrome c oxidase subunit 2
MRLVILRVCMLVAAGVFAAMFLSIWSFRRNGLHPPSFHQNLAVEVVWTAIPCLMFLAAAMPAVIAICSHAGD